MSEANGRLAEVQAAERERQRALVALDIRALQKILAEDLIHVHSSGMVHGKQEFIAHAQRLGGYIAVDRGPLDIRIEGDVAVIASQTANRLRSPETGEPVTLEGYTTQIFRRTAGGWQVFLSQLTLNRSGGAPANNATPAPNAAAADGGKTK